MRFLLDNSLSWRLARDLRSAGHDAVHVADIGLASAVDGRVYEQAVAKQQVLLTQDTDFEAIHASSSGRTGVLLLRLTSGRPAVQSAAILHNLGSLEPLLLAAEYVIMGDRAFRVMGDPDS